MNRAPTAPILLLLTGLGSSLITVVGFGPEYTLVDAGQPELATALILVVSGGFVVTGLGWLRALDAGGDRYRYVPALTLGVFSFVGTIGSFLVFQSGHYGGLAGAFRNIIFTGFILIGGGLTLSGAHWARQQAMRSPLALLASLLGIGLFYLAHQQLDLHLPIPLLGLIIVIVAVIPPMVVLVKL